MRNTLNRLFTSTKFWTTIIGLAVTAGATLFARYGIDVSTEAIQQTAVTVAGIFAILLGAQGATDFGKEAAKITASSPVPATQIAQGDIVNPPAIVVDTDDKKGTE